MSTTKVRIISQTFIILGTDPVNDIQTGNPIHAAVSQLYDNLYPDLFTAHPWRFAMKLFSLNQVNSEPIISEWRYIFQLPADLLLLWRLYPNCDYMIYEDKVYTNQSSLTAEYTAKMPEGAIPHYFELAMIYKLAAHAAMTVTQNETIAKLWSDKSDIQLGKARFTDSQSVPGIPIQRDPIYIRHYI